MGSNWPVKTYMNLPKSGDSLRQSLKRASNGHVVQFLDQGVEAEPTPGGRSQPEAVLSSWNSIAEPTRYPSADRQELHRGTGRPECLRI